jgi:hypothetical protein
MPAIAATVTAASFTSSTELSARDLVILQSHTSRFLFFALLPFLFPFRAGLDSSESLKICAFLQALEQERFGS